MLPICTQSLAGAKSRWHEGHRQLGGRRERGHAERLAQGARGTLARSAVHPSSGRFWARCATTCSFGALWRQGRRSFRLRFRSRSRRATSKRWLKFIAAGCVLGLVGLKAPAVAATVAEEVVSPWKTQFPWLPQVVADFLPVAGESADVLWLLGATTFIVPSMMQLGISPIIGFLLIGMLLGPSGFHLLQNMAITHKMADLGIVFFLFEMGLELSIKKVISMRTNVFLLGNLQYLLTGLLVAFFASRLAPALSLNALLVLGGALSLSSSAFVLQLLRDKGQLGTIYGRASFGILLLQDIAVVPLLVVMPLLVGAGTAGHVSLQAALTKACAKAFVALGGLILAGSLVLRKVFRYVKKSGSSEAFLAVTLGVVIMCATVTEGLGLSNTLGAFVGGVLVAETEYRHQVEADIAPFRGMLLGLFFVTVGCSIDVRLVAGHWATLLPLLLGLLALKASVLMGITLLCKMSLASAVQTAALLAPGGEFAFVLFGMAERLGALSPVMASLLVTTTALSMGLTPILAEVGSRVAQRIRSNRNRLTAAGRDMNDLGKIVKEKSLGFVVVCGFNAVGRAICQLLDQSNVRYIVLEDDPDTAKFARSQGLPVFLADCRRRDVLEKFRVPQSRLVVIAGSKRAASSAAAAIRRFYKDVPMLARAADAEHVEHLRSMGVDAIVPKMLSLLFGGAVLRQLGYTEVEVQGLLEEQRRSITERAAL